MMMGTGGGGGGRTRWNSEAKGSLSILNFPTAQGRGVEVGNLDGDAACGVQKCHFFRKRELPILFPMTCERTN